MKRMTGAEPFCYVGFVEYLGLDPDDASTCWIVPCPWLTSHLTVMLVRSNPIHMMTGQLRI